MKKLIVSLMMSFTLLIYGTSIFAQDEARKAEQAKQAEEARIQAKEMAEQARAEEGRVRSSERSRLSSRASTGSSFYFNDDEGLQIISDGSLPGSSFRYYTSQGSSSSNLNLSKTYNGETKENSGTFQVDESARHISLNINGVVKSGSITIKIFLSNGKVFKEVKLDDSANMSFNQSIRISDEEKKYYGDWKYIINAEKAEGRYMMQIQTH